MLGVVNDLLFVRNKVYLIKNTNFNADKFNYHIVMSDLYRNSIVLLNIIQSQKEK